MPENPVYLGDGVYATWTGHSVVLTTTTHVEMAADNVIHLDPDMVAAAKRFVDAHLDAAANAKKEPPALECDQCGSFPEKAGLLTPIDMPGERCPTSFLDDYDCDGKLVEKTT